jgi:hypothetical protein
MASWQDWKNRCFGALLLGVVATQASAVPTLSLSASPSPAVLGSPVSVNVVIGDITNLYAYQFSLAFNPALLQATAVTEGAFLATGGTTFFDGGTINNAAGTISFSFDSLIGALPGVNGGGVLASIAFNTVGAGTSALTFSDVLVLNAGLDEISMSIVNGSLQVNAVPEPAALMLFGAGLAGLAIARRRQLI